MSAIDVTMQTGEVDRLAADLTEAPLRVQLAAVKAVEASGKRMRDDAQHRAPKGPHLPHYSRSITYAMHGAGRIIEVDVYADPAKAQAALDNLLEYGSSNNPPHPHLRPALAAEAPRLEAILTRLAADGIK